jgi:hypothetical protein
MLTFFYADMLTSFGINFSLRPLTCKKSWVIAHNNYTPPAGLCGYTSKFFNRKARRGLRQDRKEKKYFYFRSAKTIAIEQRVW